MNEVRDNPAAERYELKVDGELAGFVEYRDHGPVRTLVHTEVDERFTGRGLATQLIRATLDDLRARDIHIIPICPFVKAFLTSHRDYLDLVEPKHRAGFDLPEPLRSGGE